MINTDSHKFPKYQIHWVVKLMDEIHLREGDGVRNILYISFPFHGTSIVKIQIKQYIAGLEYKTALWFITRIDESMI